MLACKNSSAHLSDIVRVVLLVSKLKKGHFVRIRMPILCSLASPLGAAVTVAVLSKQTRSSRVALEAFQLIVKYLHEVSHVIRGAAIRVAGLGCDEACCEYSNSCVLEGTVPVVVMIGSIPAARHMSIISKGPNPPMSSSPARGQINRA